MHKAEIVKLFAKTREKGFTLVPLKIYFKQGRAKMEIALPPASTTTISARTFTRRPPSARLSARSRIASATEKTPVTPHERGWQEFLHGTRITSVRRYGRYNLEKR